MEQRMTIVCAMRDARVVDRLKTRMDARFCIAHSGEEALRLCAYADVLVADAVLPDMDGLALVDKLRASPGARMPVVIGGSVHRFADEAFLQRGAACCLDVPWDAAALEAAILDAMTLRQTCIDWAALEEDHAHACALLVQLGMDSSLRGFVCLSWASALAAQDEMRLRAVRDRIYKPVAAHMGTTSENVERLIRHAIERTADTVGPREVYAFFGNTIDPMRGKPTNAQMVASVGEKIRASKRR